MSEPVSRYLHDRPLLCPRCKAEPSGVIKIKDEEHSIAFKCGVSYSRTTAGEWCRIMACRTKLERPPAPTP